MVKLPFPVRFLLRLNFVWLSLAGSFEVEVQTHAWPQGIFIVRDGFHTAGVYRHSSGDWYFGMWPPYEVFKIWEGN